MVCTGSEANDIALRMAQAVTGKTGIIATDNTYHGNTWATSQLSTRRPPIGGRAGNVRLVPAPDSLAPEGGSVEGQAEAFARAVAGAIRDLEENGPGFAGFMLCPVFANEGLPNLPPGFLDPTVAVVRRARGLILCDEVQPGFGRMGTHWWGHEALGFAPDVVTLGKPMGNGYPVAAVVARPDVMADFREAFGYFNTFGGNPVAAAAATAVLDVVVEEELMPRAAKTAARTMKLLRGLKHPAIREVRGAGLFFGLVLEEDGKPATTLATRVAEEMKDRGVLIGRIGRQMNILKLRPPLPFGEAEAELAVGTLDAVLRDFG
jgi:4-aminobutyrate aminotransferase-like enzyme